MRDLPALGTSGNRIPDMRIFSDLDGTILDVSRKHYTAYSRAVSTLKGRPLPFPEYWRMKRNGWNAQILRNSKLDSRLHKDYARRFVGLIEKRKFQAHDTLYPGARRAIDLLHAKGHKVILATARRSRLNLQWELRRLNVAATFTEVILVKGGASNAAMAKASAISRSLHFKRGESVVVGDTEVDIKCAEKLGVPVVAVANGQRTEEILARFHPNLIAKSFSRLPEVLNSILPDSKDAAGLR